MSPPPKVFISYSHDSNAHSERVLDLADRLRGDGINAEIDRYEPAPAEGWPAWCERQIAAANFVLMVCTETYHRRVCGNEAPGEGLGVVWEARLIRQEIYDAGAVSKKFIPVLFSDGTPDAIPTPIKAWTRYIVDTDAGYDDLYRRLTGQPWVTRPVLGTGRQLPARPRRSGGGNIPGSGTSAFAAATVSGEHWVNLPKLLNRGAQETVIMERLDAMARTGRDFEPLLVILPGCSGDCPGDFIERLTWRELQSVVGDERPVAFGLDWPGSTTDLFSALRELRNCLGLNCRSVTDLDSLTDKVGQLPRSFCFHHVIDNHAWQADSGALLRAWVDYFCQRWPKPPAGHLVIAFLCIELPERRFGLRALLDALLDALLPARSRALASFVKELRQRAQDEPRLVVTPAMEAICRRDVMSWVGRLREYLADPHLVEEIRQHCLAVFAEPQARCSFEDAHRNLHACLKQLMSSGLPVVGR